MTAFSKIWNAHVVLRQDGADLLWVDRHYLHAGALPAIEALDARGLRLRRPDLTFATAPLAGDPAARLLAASRRFGFDAAGPTDPRRGLLSLFGPEQGLTLPGLLVVGPDSCMATHGAFGAIALSVSIMEMTHILATQTLWQHRPRQLRVTLNGTLSPHATAIDLALEVAAALGPAGGMGYAIEFAGPAIQRLGLEDRMTLCRTMCSTWAHSALIAPDAATFAWLRARPRAPTGAGWTAAEADWSKLATDPDATFDEELTLNATAIATGRGWRSTALPTATVAPSAQPDETGVPPTMAHAGQTSLLERPAAGVRLDYVLIGGCACGGIVSLRAAADVLRGRRACVPGAVVAGSWPVKLQAEREGLDRIFRVAGLEWAASRCVACAMRLALPDGGHCAANAAEPADAEPRLHAHLMSPAMAASAALTGRITEGADAG